MALVALPLAAVAAAGARVLVTVDEALALGFPGATIERGTIYLTEEQKARVKELAGGEDEPPAIVHPYRAVLHGKLDGKPDSALVGTAYFDVHVVRTLQETVMVTVDPAGRVGRVEVLAFDEPPDYLPRAAWYRQFDGRALDAELDLRRAIRPVTGATLTARATTAAVRRVLAVHQVLEEDAAARLVPPSTPARRPTEPGAAGDPP